MEVTDNSLPEPIVIDAEVLPPSSVAYAQELFMRFTPVVDIARETGLAVTLLRDLIFKPGGWKNQRTKIHSEVVEQVREKARKRFQKGLGVGIRIIVRALSSYDKNIRTSGIEPSLDDLAKIALIVQRLDKANILMEPEEKAIRLSLSPLQILTTISKDPFYRKAIQLAGSTNAELHQEVEEALESEDSGSLAHT